MGLTGIYWARDTLKTQYLIPVKWCYGTSSKNMLAEEVTDDDTEIHKGRGLIIGFTNEYDAIVIDESHRIKIVDLELLDVDFSMIIESAVLRKTKE